MTRYIVKVDDNYHFTDESERYIHGTFATLEEAIEACKRIVDNCLKYEPGMSAEEVWAGYTGFGEDPFIVAVEDDGTPSSERVAFSAWTYAKQRCEELAARKS